MHFIVRVRIFLARHGWVRWAIVLALTAGVGWTSHQHATALEREREAWGVTVDVVVASVDLEPGDPIDAEIIAMPAAMLPSEALTALPPDGRVRQRVVSGAVITTADISRADGPAAFARPGTAVVGVVDFLAVGASIGLPVVVTSEGVVLAAEATVVGADDDVVLIAVPLSEAPMVAAAAQLGTVSLLFLP
jgi:hypothetical protein